MIELRQGIEPLTVHSTPMSYHSDLGDHQGLSRVWLKLTVLTLHDFSFSFLYKFLVLIDFLSFPLNTTNSSIVLIIYW